MSNPDTSIDPRILESAKKAFLKNGYQKTQLKEICEDAGITTGALYKRYRGKEDLFSALVQPAVEDINQLALQREQLDPVTLSNGELLAVWEMYDHSSHSWSMQAWFDFLYARKDEFTLLLTCAEGTCYGDYMDQWVERMAEGTYLYLQESMRRGMVGNPISKKELFVLMAAFWATIDKPFLLKLSKQELDVHCKIVCEMFNWKKILDLKTPE